MRIGRRNRKKDFKEAASPLVFTEPATLARELFDVAHVHGEDEARKYFEQQVCSQFFHHPAKPDDVWHDFKTVLWPAIQLMNLSPALKTAFYDLARNKHQFELGKITREIAVDKTLAYLRQLNDSKGGTPTTSLKLLFSENAAQSARHFDILTDNEFGQAATQLGWTPERLVKFMHWRLKDELPKFIPELEPDLLHCYELLYRDDPEQGLLFAQEPVPTSEEPQP